MGEHNKTPIGEPALNWHRVRSEPGLEISMRRHLLKNIYGPYEICNKNEDPMSRKTVAKNGKTNFLNLLLLTKTQKIPKLPPALQGK